ncbi:MAG TPA: hypothetical protein VHE32_03490 [Rhodanobacteraceae bacterium]|nr:hypothetical protein [Rhodanobacteraceae bacterium]
MNEMSIRFVANAFALSLLVSGCATESRIETPAPKADPEDALLVRVVAADFAHSASCNDGFAQSGMVVNTSTTSSEGMVSDVWLRRYMEPDTWVRAQPLLPRLRELNINATRIDWSIPREGDLIAKDLTGLGILDYLDLMKHVRCAATFLLPAISTDGLTALVGFFLISEHGAVAFYTLHRDRGEWWIEDRVYVAFM